MKRFLLLLATTSTMAFAQCPEVNFTNLKCEDSFGYAYTIEKASIENNYLTMIVEGESFNNQIPFQVDDKDKVNLVSCENGQLVERVKVKNSDLTAETKTTFSSSGYVREGTEITYFCDAGEAECDSGDESLWKITVEESKETCTVQ